MCLCMCLILGRLSGVQMTSSIICKDLSTYYYNCSAAPMQGNFHFLISFKNELQSFCTKQIILV